MSDAIQHVRALQILDSRGLPTIEVEVALNDGTIGRAMVPSGASTGSREAVELRDGDDQAFSGKGVLKAVSNVEKVIAPEITGLAATDQVKIDQLMIELDGTSNKGRLGANAILAVSLAVAQAAAKNGKQPLYQYLGGDTAHQLPVPMMNVINGGAHANNSIDVQEFMIVPSGFATFSKALQAGVEIYQSLKRTLDEKGLATSVGDEGGFAPELSTTREAIELLLTAIESAGYQPGKQVSVALDVAASELFKKGRYTFEGKDWSVDEIIEFYQGLIKDYPIVSIEDGLDESDWDGWRKLTATIGNQVQLVGDDIFVTQKLLLDKGISDHSANAILIKLNQVGTLTETLQTIAAAEEANFGRVISHRSGETEDTTIAHLVVATNAGQIKAGAPARSERTAKYNELLRIERQLGQNARFGSS